MNYNDLTLGDLKRLVAADEEYEIEAERKSREKKEAEEKEAAEREGGRHHEKRSMRMKRMITFIPNFTIMSVMKVKSPR